MRECLIALTQGWTVRVDPWWYPLLRGYRWQALACWPRGAMALCRPQPPDPTGSGVCSDGAGDSRVSGAGHGRGRAARQSGLVGDARPGHAAHRPARTESVLGLRAGHSAPPAEAAAGRILAVYRRLVSSREAVLAGVCPRSGSAVEGGRICLGAGGSPGPGPARAGR